MFKKIALLFLAGAAFTACSDDDSPSDQQLELDVPQKYEFTRNGQSTVSFSGQTTRIEMAESIVGDLKEFDNEQVLLDRFSNNNDPFNDPDLNASSKSIKSKVAASKDYFADNASASAEIRNDFELWISNQVNEVGPNENVNAAPGVPGQIADGSSTRYVNGNGLEYDQLFTKSLIGALMLDQTLNNYLSPAVLDESTNREDNDQELLVTDRNYTTMEHKWDEAYGYVFGAAADPTDPLATLGQDDSFLNKYLGRLEGDPSFTGTTAEIYNAFKRGRAAIVAGEYEERDEQAAIIREKLSELIGIRAVYYLKTGEVGINASDMGAAFHDLSEGYGFIYSLQFTRVPGTTNPYFSKNEVDAILDEMLDDGPNGLWDVEAATLATLAQQIANEFDFTVEEAADSSN